MHCCWCFLHLNSEAARSAVLVLCTLLLAASPAGAAPPLLRANQVGYSTHAPKLGIAMARQPLAGAFELVDVRSGQVVLRRAVRPLPAAQWGRYQHLAELDFTAWQRVGRYRLRLGEATSFVFAIEPDPFSSLPDAALEFMRQQRCGQNPWLAAACHPHDGKTVYGPLPAGTRLDVTGGWHDAGDLLKYLLTSSNATAQMLLAWQLLADAPDDQAAAWFPDRLDAAGQPQPNGLPDVLDEARWGLQWLLKLHPAPDQLYHQVADDRDHYGLRLPQNEKADYGWGPGRHRPVYFADGRPQGLGRHHSNSDGIANLAGRYAAAMALAWQIWHEDPDQRPFARRCLQAGQEVYRLGQANEGVQQGNSYSSAYRYAETTWADDMQWGAAELFRATGQQAYLQDARRYARRAAAASWMGRQQTDHYQYYPFLNVAHFRLHALVDADLQAQLAGYYREGLEACAAAARDNPFGIGVPFIWCSNNLVTALATQSLLYEQMTGDSRYARLAARHVDWLLGRNPWGTTMITEIGSKSPQDVHLMTTRLTGRRVRGGLVDGPVYERIFRSLKGVHIRQPDPLREFQDQRAVYHDDWGDYSTNEPTMDGTASTILLWAAARLRRPHGSEPHD